MAGGYPRVVIEQGTNVKRKLRRPSHPWLLKFRPWQIQPCMIAPVLPGETLKNINFQTRTVTDPIGNPLIGWHLEHYFFYVRLTDLYARDLFMAMVLKPETDLSTLDAATDQRYYHMNATDLAINWPKLCTEVIVNNYFRNEGEVAGDYVSDTMYVASVNTDNALDSAMNDSAFVGLLNVDQNLTSAVAGQGDASAQVWTSEIDKAMRDYHYALLMKTTDMTFEDWCRSFGVSLPQQEDNKPELLRYVKDWQYPSNTINPSTGVPTSAVSWSVQGRADKDRFFTEPGFIVGLVVCRPKIYFQNLDSHMTMLMRSAYGWLPPQLASDPRASFIKVSAGDPPLDANTGAYWLDVKDLFLYGDQFTNYNLATDVKINKVALPNAALTNKRYAASTDADNLFVDTTAGLGVVRQDGVAQLHILGRQVETSPQNVGTNKTV